MFHGEVANCNYEVLNVKIKFYLGSLFGGQVVDQVMYFI
jgi:hypothetical protein